MVGQICKIWREMKAITAMVVVQIALAGLNILFKLSVEDGMNPRVLVKIGKRFGEPYWNVTLMNMMGSIVAVLIAVCWKNDLKEWKLGWNIRLVTIAYAAIVISGMVVAVTAWCVESRGPLFVSVFSPVGLVIVALVGSFVLNETLHIGSIIGAVIIVGGLYLVLWGKNKEIKSMTTTSDHIETKKTSNELPKLSPNVP